MDSPNNRFQKFDPTVKPDQHGEDAGSWILDVGQGPRGKHAGTRALTAASTGWTSALDGSAVSAALDGPVRPATPEPAPGCHWAR